MAIVRIALSVVKSGLFKPKNANAKIPTFGIMACTISSFEVTKNITIITAEKKKPKIINLKLENVNYNDSKPLIVMLSWLMARKKHIFKYADFYLKQGFDVMNISVSPWQLLWPTKGTQMVASDILNFLNHNTTYSPLVIHGFSVGGYVWSEVMVQMAAEQDRFQHILDRIIGQVWDSLADITEMPEGLPVAVFPRNTVLQSALKQYIIYHLKTFDKVATCHYVRASQMFHTNLVRAPALFFISKSDPIGAESSNRRARESWENMGIQTYWKSWEETPHVGHFRHYPDEYRAELKKFIDVIGFNRDSNEESLNVGKVQAKL